MATVVLVPGGPSCCLRPDVPVCPRCGGRPRLLGTIEDPIAIRAILESLAASAEPVDRAPPATTLEPATLATRV